MTSELTPTTHSATVSNEVAALHIFDIPPELRLDIYASIISDFDCMAATKPEHGKYYLPILNTCQTFRNEALRPWLRHLRTARDEAEVKYQVADRKVAQYLGDMNITFDMDVYLELKEAEKFARMQFWRLRDLFRVDSGTALDHAVEASHIEEGIVELLDWLKLNT